MISSSDFVFIDFNSCLVIDLGNVLLGHDEFLVEGQLYVSQLG